MALRNILCGASLVHGVDMPSLASPRCPCVAGGKRPGKGRQAGDATWDYEVARRSRVWPGQRSHAHPLRRQGAHETRAQSTTSTATTHHTGLLPRTDPRHDWEQHSSRRSRGLMRHLPPHGWTPLTLSVTLVQGGFDHHPTHGWTPVHLVRGMLACRTQQLGTRPGDELSPTERSLRVCPSTATFHGQSTD